MHSNLDSKFSSFARGFSTPLRVIHLCFDHPKLFVLSITPMLVTIFILSFLIYALLAGAWALVHQFFLQWIAQYSAVFSGITVFFVALIALYFSFHALNLLLALFASPFNDLLAEATERACGAVQIKTSVFSLARVFVLDLRKTILAFSLVVLFTLISFAPVLGLVSFIGFSMIQAFTFITYPQSRRRHGIIDSLKWMRVNWALSLGFGLVTLISFSIPFINLFALPLSVMGGTMIYLKK